MEIPALKGALGNPWRQHRLGRHQLHRYTETALPGHCLHPPDGGQRVRTPPSGFCAKCNLHLLITVLRKLPADSRLQGGEIKFKLGGSEGGAAAAASAAGPDEGLPRLQKGRRPNQCLSPVEGGQVSPMNPIQSCYRANTAAVGFVLATCPQESWWAASGLTCKHAKACAWAAAQGCQRLRVPRRLNL